MDTPSVIALIAVLLIVGGAVAYIVKAKKSGKKCIGCPESGSCHACTRCASREEKEQAQEDLAEQAEKEKNGSL